MATKDGRRAPGGLEAEVMGVLWERQTAMPAAQVQAALGGDLAYNTVQTILARLHDKGIVQRRRAGRVHVYWPTQDPATAAAERMRDVLGRQPDRMAVLQQFAARLDESDAALLRDVLGTAAEPGRT